VHYKSSKNKKKFKIHKSKMSANIISCCKKVSFQLFSKLSWVCHGAQIFRQCVPSGRSCIWKPTFRELCAQPRQRVVGWRCWTETRACTAGTSGLDDGVESWLLAGMRDEWCLCCRWECCVVADADAVFILLILKRDVKLQLTNFYWCSIDVCQSSLTMYWWNL